MTYDIAQDYLKYVETQIQGPRLQSNLRASSIGFPCDMHHYLALTEYRQPVSPGLQMIFDEGKIHEVDVENKLRQAGYDVESKQVQYRNDSPLITGQIDGRLSKDGGPWWPFDAKSINQFDFVKLNSAEDFIHSKKVHQRNYATQILIYMLLQEPAVQYGCLILKNKQSGAIKDVWFDADQHFDLLDDAFKRAERVYSAKEKKEAPERTEDLDLCLRCDFREKCLPDLKNAANVKLVDPENVLPQIERIQELAPLAKEHKKLDEEVKDLFKAAGMGDYVTGDYLIRVKEQKRAAFSVKESTFLTTKIAKMK